MKPHERAGVALLPLGSEPMRYLERTYCPLVKNYHISQGTFDTLFSFWNTPHRVFAF